MLCNVLCEERGSSFPCTRGVHCWCCWPHMQALSFPGSLACRLLELSTAATHSVSKSWQGLSNLGRDCWLHAWQSSLLGEEGELNLTRSSAGFLHSHIQLLWCSLYRTALESAVKLPADKSNCCLLAKELFIPGSWWSPWYSWTAHPAGNKAPISMWLNARARGTLHSTPWKPEVLCWEGNSSWQKSPLPEAAPQPLLLLLAVLAWAAVVLAGQTLPE